MLARLPDAPAGVKRHFAVRRAEIPGQRRRLASARATTCICVSIEHKLGIHGSPTAVMAFGDKGGAHRLSGRRAQSRPRIHVHHDERRPARCRAGGRGHRRARLPAGASPTRTSACRASRIGGRPSGAPIIHHPDVRRMLHGHEGAHRGHARAGLLSPPAAWTCAHVDPTQASGAAARAVSIC